VLLTVGALELPALMGWVHYGAVISPPASVQFTRLKPWQQATSQFDPELLFVRRPYLRLQGRTNGDMVDWLGIATSRTYEIDARYDRHGFRNASDLAEAEIVAIGDSFLEAGLVQFADLLTTRVGERLRAAVANLGQGAYAPQQELVVLRRYGLPLRPRLVLWFFFEGNDLTDVPRFEQWRREARESPEPVSSYADRSLVRNAVDTVRWRIRRKRDADALEATKRSCHPVTLPDERIYFAYPGKPLTKSDDAALAVVERILLEASRASTSADAAFLLAFIPTKYRVYRGLCEFPPGAYGADWQLNDLPDRLSRWAQEHQVPFLDLTPPLVAAASRGELVYFADDGHWNASGPAVAADTISDYLTRTEWTSVRVASADTASQD
jgi:hypothetical protein